MSAPHPWYARTEAGPAIGPSPGSLPGGPRDAPASPASPLRRLLGGPPLAVFARLFFVSLLVGAFLMWLDIRPFEVFRALTMLVDRLFSLGWESVRALGQYVLAGAVLVVPCWLVMRLMSYRGR